MRSAVAALTKIFCLGGSYEYNEVMCQNQNSLEFELHFFTRSLMTCANYLLIFGS